MTLHDACVAYAEACDAYEAAAARSAAARRAGERGWQRLNTCAMEAHARMDAALRALGAVARVEISRFVVDVRDGLWLDNDMTTEQITWAKVGQFTWTADHYGNDVEVWLDDNGYWGWRVMWNGGSDRGWADTMEDAKAEATR